MTGDNRKDELKRLDALMAGQSDGATGRDKPDEIVVETDFFHAVEKKRNGEPAINIRGPLPEGPLEFGELPEHEPHILDHGTEMVLDADATIASVKTYKGSPSGMFRGVLGTTSYVFGQTVRLVMPKSEIGLPEITDFHWPESEDFPDFALHEGSYSDLGSSDYYNALQIFRQNESELGKSISTAIEGKIQNNVRMRAKDSLFADIKKYERETASNPAIRKERYKNIIFDCGDYQHVYGLDEDVQKAVTRIAEAFKEDLSTYASAGQDPDATVFTHASDTSAILAKESARDAAPETIGFAKSEDLPETMAGKPETAMSTKDETVIQKHARPGIFSELFSYGNAGLVSYKNDFANMRNAFRRGAENVAGMTNSLFEASRSYGAEFSEGAGKLKNKMFEIGNYDVGKPLAKAGRFAGYTALAAVTLAGSGAIYNSMKSFEKNLRAKSARASHSPLSPLKPEPEVWPVVPFGPSEIKLGPYSGEAKPSEKAQPRKIMHTVKKDQVLEKIARSYGTTVEEVAQLNGIKNPNLIYVGQELVIPNGFDHIDYSVAEGQSLSLIGQNFGASVDEMVRINPDIKNPNLIYPGQRIRVPVRHETRKVSEILFDEGIGTLGIEYAKPERIVVKLSDYKNHRQTNPAYAANNDNKPAPYNASGVTERYNDIISRNPTMGVEDAFRLAAGISKSDYDGAKAASSKMAA